MTMVSEADTQKSTHKMTQRSVETENYLQITMAYYTTSNIYVVHFNAVNRVKYFASDKTGNYLVSF